MDCPKKTAIELQRIDHIVLTVTSIEKSVEFYREVLGMEKIVFDKGRVALSFGNQKINLHEHGKESEPKAKAPKPGSEDICFITNTHLSDAMKHVQKKGIEIIEGPVNRTGALGPIKSFYFRDPDQNLIEVANYSTN